MSVTLLRVLEHRENETRRGGGAGLAGFLSSSFVIQGPDFHIEPPLGSSGKTKTAGSAEERLRWQS
jgi:hypothetical protein